MWKFPLYSAMIQYNSNENVVCFWQDSDAERA